MPYFETPTELADHIADLCGVYGAHDDDCEQGRAQPMNPCVTKCRVCLVFELATRIRESVANEHRLANSQPEGTV